MDSPRIPASSSPAEPSQDRRTRILDAAERCFVREGFHRTTMQAVATEAGMSPGNLYRYFPSKRALVAGIAERDRTNMRADFSAVDDDGDFLSAMNRLGRKYFEDMPIERAILGLQIWAEAARDRDIAAINAEVEREILSHLEGLVARAGSRGGASVAVNPRAAALVISMLGNGLFVRRAIGPEYDANREIFYVFQIVEALLSGRLVLDPDNDANGSTP